MQCKYSENINTNLQNSEIWKEIVTVIQHYPNHYIVFTNRNITPSFKDWWDRIACIDGRRNFLIPFSIHMVGREDIEKLLNMWHDIREKYFD